MQQTRSIRLIAFICSVVLVINIFAPFAKASSSENSDLFDFWLIANRDGEIYSHWLNLVEYNDHWYISAEDACFFSGFTSFENINGELRFQRPPFYKDYDLNFHKTPVVVICNMTPIVYEGKEYYEFNSLMNSLRTKVSFSETTNLLVFETCKVFPVEFNYFCSSLVISDGRNFVDSEDSAAPLTAIGVNFFSDICAVFDFLTGKDIDEVSVLKNIIETPPLSDPNMTEYFHVEEDDDFLSALNRRLGYYDDIRKAGWGDSNLLWSRHGLLKKPEWDIGVPGYPSTGDAINLYKRIYSANKTGGVNGLSELLNKYWGDVAGSSSGSSETLPSQLETPTPTTSSGLSLMPDLSLALWDAYNQWQKCKEVETVYPDALGIVFSGDTYGNCPTELKISVDHVLNLYDRDSFYISKMVLENLATKALSHSNVYKEVKAQLKTPMNALISIIDSELGTSASISEMHKSYVINEIQRQCRFKFNTEYSVTSDSACNMMGTKYITVLYLRAYLYACSLWEDGPSLNKFLIEMAGAVPGVDEGMSEEDIEKVKEYYSNEIDRVAPLLARILQFSDEELVSDVNNIIGNTNRYGILSFHDEITDKDVSVKIDYLNHDASDYDDSFFSSLKQDSHFYYGSYEQDNNYINGPEPIEWVVRRRNDNSVTVMSVNILDRHTFTDAMWHDSELRRWCNKEFINSAFADYEVFRLEYVQYKGGVCDSSQSYRDDFSSVDKVLLNASGKAVATAYAKRDGVNFDDKYWNTAMDYNYAWGERGHTYTDKNGVTTGGWTNGIFTDNYGVRPQICISLDPDYDSFRSLFEAAEVGDLVVLGNDELNRNADDGPEPIEWMVMGRSDGQLFLETYYPINGISDSNIDVWKDSSVREWLNGDFYNSLSEKEREYIVQTTLSSANGCITQDYFFPNTRGAWQLTYRNSGEVQSGERTCSIKGVKNPITLCTVVSLDGKTPSLHPIEGKYSHQKTDINSCSTNYSVGESFFFGNYEQDMNFTNGSESIEWIILDVSGSKALLLSKYCIDSKYPAFSENGVSNNIINWISNDFPEYAFSDEERQMINGSVFFLNNSQCERYLPVGNPNRTALITHYTYCPRKGTSKIYYSDILEGDLNSNIYLTPDNKYNNVESAYGSYWATDDINTRGRISTTGEYLNSWTDFPCYVRPAVWINIPDVYYVSNETEFIDALTNPSAALYTISIESDFSISEDYSELLITHGNINFNGHTILVNRQGNNDYFFFGNDQSTIMHLEGGETDGSSIRLDSSFAYFMLRDRKSTINNVKIYIGNSEQTITPTPTPCEEFAVYGCYPLQVEYEKDDKALNQTWSYITIKNISDNQINSWSLELTFEESIKQAVCYTGASFKIINDHTVIFKNDYEWSGSLAPGESRPYNVCLTGVNACPKQPLSVRLTDVSPSVAPTITPTCVPTCSITPIPTDEPSGTVTPIPSTTPGVSVTPSITPSVTEIPTITVTTATVVTVTTTPAVTVTTPPVVTVTTPPTIIVTTTPVVTVTTTPAVTVTKTPTVKVTTTPGINITTKPTTTEKPTPTQKVILSPTATPTVTATITPTATTMPTVTVVPTTSPRPTISPTPIEQYDDYTDDNSDIVLKYGRTAITNMVCGDKIVLDLDTDDPDATIKWKSSNPSVASVSKSGKVTAKMAGSVTVTCSAEGKKAYCVIQILYKDVKDPAKFWYSPTNYLTNAGVVKGYDKQTKFKPANMCTRAQMVTFIWRLQGEPAPMSKSCKFTDVKSTDYFYKACIWGNENHIVEGYKDGTFGPQIVCARKHAVTFLWRLAEKPEPTSENNKFSDVKKKDYFYKATLWASEMGILAGYSDGTFKPDGDCLRRQMVTFLYKYDKFVNGKG